MYYRRLAALLLCFGLLGGLFVLGGAGYLGPASPGLDLTAPSVDPGDHAGEDVAVGGDVVATDPVVIEIEDPEGTQHLPIENAPDVEKGQELTVDGTLTEEGTLEARPDRAVVREPWETTYMYAVSALAGLLVVTLAVDSWGFHLRTLSVYPREEPLHTQLERWIDDG